MKDWILFNYQPLQVLVIGQDFPTLTHYQVGLSLTRWQDGVYDVNYTIDGNCPSGDTVSVTILPKPEINISLNQNLPCVGNQLVVDNLSNDFFTKRRFCLVY